MQQIVIKKFGPITDIRILVTDFITLIGPQASGKSTISKSIYFFKSLRDELYRYTLEAIEEGNYAKPVAIFSKKIKAMFMNYWGTTHHLKDIYIRYYFDKDKHITLTIKKSYLNVDFSSKFREGLVRLFYDLEDTAKKYKKRDKTFLSSSELLAIETNRRSNYKKIESLCNVLFEEDKDLVFIPAGRSLLSTLTEQLSNLESNRLDYLMRAFISRINNSKQIFNKTIEEIILEKKKLTTESINMDKIKLAQSLIEKILKGKYKYDSDGEKLFIDDKRFTRLNHSSSGQQESIWIVLLIFLLILDNKKVFIVFEEPEAHLYPIAQKEMIDLIALLANISGNQIIITTHSPYILSSLNNLLYAHRLGQGKGEKIRKIISDKFWINPSQFQAYYISTGTKNNIMDRNESLIMTEAIDGASEQINQVYNKLFEIDE